MTAPQPTDFELEILQELWARGPLTVREVHDTLSKRRQLVYTSVLKALQLMFEKKLVLRDESQRSHVYEAAVEEDSVKSSIVGDLMDQVFGGSAAGLAMHALSTRPASSEDIKKIQVLLETLESQQDAEKKSARGRKAK